MTFEMAEAGLGAQDVRIPFFLFGDGGAAFVPDSPRSAPGDLAAADEAPSLEQALARLPGCGCGGRAAGPAEIFSAPAAAAQLVIPELPLDREPEYRRLTDGIGGRSGAPWLIEAESAVMIMPATGDSGSGTAKPSSLRSESTSPGNYNDANGNGQWDEGEEIFIDGDSSREVDDGGGSVEVGGDPTLGGGDTGPAGGGGGGLPAPTPPDMECLSDEEKSQLSEKELEAYEVAEEAAEIFREIKSMPDYDRREYGAIIYRDINGVITHTPLTPGTVTSVPNMDLTGLPGYGSMIALVHLHPAITYGADAYGNFDFKLYPTPGADGDWPAFDWFVQAAYNDLIGRGFSHDQALAKVSSIHQYVIGPKGEAGSDLYEIRKYEADDRDTSTLGQKIPETLGQCGS